MNIEKIKNYNQVMLSVVVTAAVAFAVIGLMAFVFFLLNEVFNVFDRGSSYSEPSYQEKSIYDDKNEELSDKLQISYGFPTLIDSLNQLYIIPVGRRSNEHLREEYFKDISFSKEESYGDGGSDYYDRNYVNMIIYDAKNQKAETLFKKKVLIDQYGQTYFKDDVLVLFEASDSDSDKDGTITMADQTSVFIYSMQSKSLKQVKYGDKSVLKFEFINGTKDLIIRFGLNASQMSTSLEKINTMVLCKYNYELDQLIPINDEKLQKELLDIDKRK